MSSSQRPRVRKKKRWGKVIEFTPKSRNLVMDNRLRKKIEGEIKKAKILTPQALSDRHDIRVSTSKKLLAELEEQGKVRLVHQTSRTKCYAPA